MQAFHPKESNIVGNNRFLCQNAVTLVQKQVNQKADGLIGFGYNLNVLFADIDVFVGKQLANVSFETLDFILTAVKHS